MAKPRLEHWVVWYPRAAASGLLLARGRIAPTNTLLLHAAPDVITVEVMAASGERLAFGEELKRTQESPMCRLRRQGKRVVREDIWPGGSDVGSVVILPGGEAGLLKVWWHADDKSEWRWQVEFYNPVAR
ncbi:MAG: DUF7712 family protein [Anaerolineales bacterium]